MGKVPIRQKGKRVLIICEGFEEYDYLNRIKECAVWSQDIRVDIKNAKSINEISARYEYEYQNGAYELIVIFCDTEKAPYEQFITLKKDLYKFHGNKAADRIVFFANPCTMQIILSHFENVSLKTNSKSKNEGVIKKCSGVANYEATENQRKAIMKKITPDNYFKMKERLVNLNKNYTIVPSSNCIVLFDGLEGKILNWIKNCNKEIEKE